MTTLQESFYEELRRKFNNHSVFKVCLRGLNEIRLSLEDDDAYLNREIENAICSSWCALFTEHRESLKTKQQSSLNRLNIEPKMGNGPVRLFSALKNHFTVCISINAWNMLVNIEALGKGHHISIMEGFAYSL